jgi:biopolymer transport protein ExbD
MPKIKMPKAAPSLDMTPMVDLAFLLVTFFMLTASVRVSEPVIVDTPSAVSDKLLPENVILVTVDDKGRAFFNINNPEVRIKTLERMAAQYKLTFDDKEKKRFGGMTSFGLPIASLKSYIDMEDPQRVKEAARYHGVPLDSLHPELANWIKFGGYEAAVHSKMEKEKAERLGHTYKYEKLRYALKCDSKTKFMNVKQVLKVFTDLDIYQFNLITNLEQGEEKQ